MNSRICALSLTSMLLAACAGTGSYGYSERVHYARCVQCGTVEEVQRVAVGSGRSSGAGAVIGAIVGGALGNQVGSGDGRKAATVAGAVAGGIAGNSLERQRNQRDLYAIYVRMDDGRRLVFEQYQRSGLYEGVRVQIRRGEAHRL